MRSGSASRRREQLTLAADGCLLTAGAFAVMAGAAFILEWLGVAPLGEPGGSGLTLLLSTVSWLLQVGGFVVGPLLAWRLNGRRLGKTSVIGMVAGFLLGGALVMPVAMLGAAIDWVVGLFTTVEFAGAIGYLVLVVLAFFATLVWIDIDAVRDLSSDHRAHVPLDVGRLVATAAVVVFGAVVIGKVIGGEDALEAFVFLLLGAVQGAVVVTIADVAVRLVESRAAAQDAPTHT